MNTVMRRGTDGVELLSARSEEAPRAELFDASGAAFPAPPEFTLLHERELSWPAKFGVQRLLHAGLKMAEDGKSVFTWFGGREATLRARRGTWDTDELQYYISRD